MKRVLLVLALAVSGLWAQSLTVIVGRKPRAVDLAAMKHVKITATNDHEKDKSSHEYGGVLLSELLAQAGVPTGEAFRGEQLTRAVIAAARDNYHVLFSAAELEPSVGGEQVLIADEQDGKPLDLKTGPLRLVVPSDKRPARWVRNLVSIEITDFKLNIDVTAAKQAGDAK